MPPDHEALDQAVADEESVLADCADMLKRRVPLEEWSVESVAAFRLALVPNDCTDLERQKAWYLARHLRVEQTEISPPAAPSERIRRSAERIRADLLRLVPLAAGEYLTPGARPALRSDSFATS